MDGGQPQRLGPQRVYRREQGLDLLLQPVDLGGDTLELVAVLKAARAAVRGVQAGQAQVAASLAGVLAVAFDLAAFAFIAVWGRGSQTEVSNGRVRSKLEALGKLLGDVEAV